MDRSAVKSISLRRRALLGTTALLLIAGSVAGLPAPAAAGFSEGTAAYEAGDYTRAYNEWLPLARAGNAAAQRNIGQLYRLGLGVPKDLKVAANWYRLAADQGLARAQANLGVMYLRGEGVDREPETAAAWFRKAADQGHVISQYNLALMLEQGYGVARNRAEAAKWFSRAADEGHDKAGDRLAALLSESVVPAAGETARPAPAQPTRTARAEEYLPSRVLNRGRRPPQQTPTVVAEATPPRSTETEVASQAAAQVTEPQPVDRRDRLTEALTAPPSPANIAGTPAARFAVQPEPTSRPRVAQLPETAPESRGLSRPAFLRPAPKPAREDDPVDVALSNAPERAAPPRTASVPPKPIIEVPVAPFLKAEAQTTRPAAPPPRTQIETPVAPFLAVEARADEKAPEPPAAPVAPVQVAAITAPPKAGPVSPPQPAEKAALVLPPAKATKPVPGFLKREAMAPPPGLGLENRFGPNSYLVPRDIPVTLRVDATPSVPLDPPQRQPATLALREDIPPPPPAPEAPAFLVREARAPQPDAPPPAKRTPVQVAALPAVPRPDAAVAPQVAATATSPFGTRISLFYVRQAQALAETTADESTQLAALTTPSAPAATVVKPVPVFLKEEAAAPRVETQAEPVAAVIDDDRAPAFLRREALDEGDDAPADKPTPAFLIAEAKLPDEPVVETGPDNQDATALAIESDDAPPVQVARAAPAFLAEEARRAPVPDLLRREAAVPPVDDDQDETPPARTAALSDRPVAEPVPAAAPLPPPPSKVPDFLRDEALTGALAIVDTPRAGDPVGRAKRVTALLGAAEDAARTRAPQTIPQYYRDRAALVAETQASGTEPPPLPFLRRAPRAAAQAPIQPTPDLLVNEARRGAAPVADFLRDEADRASGSRTIPGTGQAPAETQVAVRTTEDAPHTANQPRRYTETAGDRRAVNAGVAAYLSRDYEQALSFWMPAAERGNPDAQFFVGGLYLDGNGVTRDLITAHIWFARSSAQGHARAREQIALLRKIMTQDQFAEAERRAGR